MALMPYHRMLVEGDPDLGSATSREGANHSYYGSPAYIETRATIFSIQLFQRVYFSIPNKGMGTNPDHLLNESKDADLYAGEAHHTQRNGECNEPVASRNSLT